MNLKSAECRLYSIDESFLDVTDQNLKERNPTSQSLPYQHY